jgi:PAS domain S-box-containing protein
MPFWESDKNGNCIYASEKLGEVIGLPPNYILGNGWETNLKDSDKERLSIEWENAVKKKRRFIQNYTFVHENGDEVRVQGQAFPIIHNGNLEGFVGILTEIK